MLGVFGPRSVVQADVFCSGDLQAQCDDCGGYARAAGRGDRFRHVHAFGDEDSVELFGGFQTSVFDQFGEGEAGCSGHVAGAESGARLWSGSGEAACGAGVQDLGVFGDLLLDLGEVLHCILVQLGLEAGLGAMDLARFRGEIGFYPR